MSHRVVQKENARMLALVSSIMRPATGKLGAAVSSPSSSPERPATDAGVEQNVRRKRGVAWVEITDRPAKTAVPYGERVANDSPYQNYQRQLVTFGCKKPPC